MRRFTSILLVFLLIFNSLGFYGFIVAVKYHHNKALAEQLDADNYNHRETVILEFSHSIPYAIDQPEFYRVDGEFKHEGEYYKMVKQRVSVDTIYMIAIKDKMAQKAHDALSGYSESLAAEKPGEKPDGKISVNFLKDYFGSSFAMVVISYGHELSNLQNSAPQKQFTSGTSGAIFNPPETT